MSYFVRKLIVFAGYLALAYLSHTSRCDFSRVRGKFLQAYLLSGGSNGRLARGDAMIEMDFIDQRIDQDANADEFYFT